MIQVRRLGYASFETPDIERQIDYYANVIGLIPVARERDRGFLAARTGQIALEFVRAAAPRCTRLCFEVAPGEDFADITKRLTADSIKTELRHDPAPGTPQSLAFEDPKGTTIELFSEWRSQGRDRPAVGIAPFKLGHVAFMTSDLKSISEFYGRVLGFKVSDWIADFFVFMRCNADHHVVNFITGKNAGMHHIAYELRDFAHLQNACDLFGQRKIPIIWGPVRLGPGHNVAIFHRDPDDWVVELYAELDQMKDEELGYFDPRPWHREHPQRPKVWTREEGFIWGPPPIPDFFRGRE
jgi:catechol 2,3-dioxygenase-like lactoylglutathione lyase family enzyme